MAWTVPQMPLTLQIWIASDGHTPDDPPDFEVPCNLALGRSSRTILRFDDEDDIRCLPRTILIPTGGYVPERTTESGSSVPDICRIAEHPIGWIYEMAAAEYVGLGFPNEHVAIIAVLPDYDP